MSAPLALIKQLIETSNDPSVLGYHHPDFTTILAEVLECDIDYLTVADNTGLHGLMPYAVKRGRYGLVVNSMPFFGINSCLLVNGSAEKLQVQEKLMKEYVAVAERLGASAQTLYTPINSQGVSSLATDCGLPPAVKKFTQQVALKLNEIPWPKKKMADLRRAATFNFLVRPGKPEDTQSIWEVYRHRCAETGAREKPKLFLQRTLERATEDGPIIWLVAEKNNETAAALLCLKGPKTLSYTLPVVWPKYRASQVGSLLLDIVARQAQESGVEFLNLESSPARYDPVYNYKKRWGGYEQLYDICSVAYDKTILSISEKALVSEYPYFFVRPFKSMTGLVHT